MKTSQLDKQKYLVHVVEDSTIDFRALKRACQKTKYADEVEFQRFQSAEEALEAHSSEEALPDLFLIDLNLKKKTGLELLADLATLKKISLVPKIMYSTSDNRREIETCFSRGGVGYLVKPLELKVLSELLEKCLTYWFDTSRRPLDRRYSY